MGQLILTEIVCVYTLFRARKALVSLPIVSSWARGQHLVTGIINDQLMLTEIVCAFISIYTLFRTGKALVSLSIV